MPDNNPLYPGEKRTVNPDELKAAPHKDIKSFERGYQQDLQKTINALYKQLLDPNLDQAEKENIKHQIVGQKHALTHTKKASVSPQSVAKFTALLKQDCSQVLLAYRKTKMPLLRGVRNATQDQFKGKTRENRRPMDTGEKSHKALDNMLSTAGFETNRSNSIFCSTSRAQANMYGTTYVIFPINGFKFLWSEKYKDLYSDFYENDQGEKLLTAVEMGIDMRKFQEIDHIAESALAAAYHEADDLIDIHQRTSKKLEQEAVDLIWSIREGTSNKIVHDLIRLRDPRRGIDELKYTFEQLGKLREIDPMLAETIFPKARVESLIRFVDLVESATPPGPEEVNDFIRNQLQFRDTGFVAALESKNEVCIHGEYYAFGEDIADHILQQIYK